MDYDDPKLTSLLHAARDRADRDAFDRLFGAFSGQLLLFIRYRMPASIKDRLDPEDILQDVYLRAFKRFERLPEHNTRVFHRWLIKLTYRMLLSAVEEHRGRQKRDVRREKKFDTRIAENLGQNDGSPSSLASHGERAEILLRIINQLPESYREIIMLRDFEGLETSEICEKMEKSQGAVHVLYHRACAKLSELLAAEGIDNAQF